jgi:hypothetical protein
LIYVTTHQQTTKVIQELRMKKVWLKRMRWGMAVCLLVCTILTNTTGSSTRAATFDEVNQDSVFLKQASGSNTCTLVAAAMMVRRAAMMNGNTNWASITEDVMRTAAWVEGTGLKWNFTVSGITVTHASFSGSAQDLQNKLAQHPEGVVLYKQKTDQQHAILVTDYTDGVFYCADPSGAKASGRIPISSASITVDACNYMWYVTSPTLYLTNSAGSSISHAVETAQPTATPKATATAAPKATATAKPKTTAAPKATATAKTTSQSKVSAPKKVKGVKVKNDKKKTLTITWDKVSGADGYQVRFGAKKNLSGSASVTLEGRRAALTDLTKGSVFYAKVRAYKLNGTKKVYGAYSVVKKGKVKK